MTTKAEKAVAEYERLIAEIKNELLTGAEKMHPVEIYNKRKLIEAYEYKRDLLMRS